MAKVDITKTELVWPGKYNEDGTLKAVPRVSLPFQVIETINESRATREAKQKPQQGRLFNIYAGTEGDTFEAGWKNKLIWGDNLLVMGSLLEKFAGKVDLIYIDPPFATGTDFSVKAQVGEVGEELTKEQTIIEEKAYRDTWGRGIDSYITMMYERLTLMRELLADGGSIYVHCDWRVNSVIRLIMDYIFGEQNFRNEIIWRYRRWPAPQKNFQKMHDTICRYSKTAQVIWNQTYEEKSASTLKAFGNTKLTTEITEKGTVKKIKTDEVSLGTYMSDVWEISMIQGSASKERSDTGNYPTQKPEALVERIIKASSNESDLVADFFCGSGTTAAVAEKLGRRWIASDLGRWGVHTARKRMLGIENCKPFEILNLGKYERQYWQSVTFGGKANKPLTEKTFYEYLVFILKLYGASPVSGMTHLHGKKGKALVHVGTVDAPVTIKEIGLAVDECAKLKQKNLHILGWEWEMGLNGLMDAEAKKQDVKPLLLQIPHEVMEQQATDRGEVRFFELAYLEAAIKKPKKRTAQVTLKDFVIPNTELIPEEVRDRVRKWSDYIDYWAIDWNFQNDTFMQGWVTYRTRKARKLSLASDPHTYEKPGKYRVLVKVIDVFGNDTSQALDVTVK